MQLTQRDKSILEAMRTRIAGRYGFGITVSDDNVTLRFSEGDTLIQVGMVVQYIDDGSKEKCWSCDDPETSHVATVKIEQCGGFRDISVLMCSDCYCPK